MPDILWRPVPGGQVTIEKHGVLDVAPFRIAAFAVTFNQFRAFVEADDGFVQMRWWEDLERRDPYSPWECKSFSAVANNYGGGGKSFKEAMEYLESTSRKVADACLHTHLRITETLPAAQQVNCSQQLDLLLAEIVRITSSAYHKR